MSALDLALLPDDQRELAERGDLFNPAPMLADPAGVGGTIVCRLLPEGKLASVSPMTFGKSRINRGTLDGLFFEDGW